jgi:hypothetical protein
LAIFRQDEEDPIVLVEIKYNDRPLPETVRKASQIADYQAWRAADEGNRHVLLLSREIYRADGIEVRRWDDLTRHLRDYSKHRQSDLIDMLVAYLEEEGNAMQNIDGHSLTKYLKRFLCDGRVGANNFNGPIEFSKLLRNMQLISGFFHGHFKTAWKEAGGQDRGDDGDFEDNGARKIATIDFRVFPRVKSAGKRGAAIDANGWVDVGRMDGGKIYVFARHSMGGGRNWLRVNYGFCLQISPSDNETEPPQASLFAEVLGPLITRQKENLQFRKKINYALMTEDAERASRKIEAELKSLVIKVVDSVFKNNVELPKKQLSALTLLRHSLASGEYPPLPPTSVV